MKVWSRGLGRVELGFDLKKVKIEFAENQLVLSGKTEPPVSWDFVIKMDVSEAWLLVRVGVGKKGISYFSKYLQYKLMNRDLLNERVKDAWKTKVGVQPPMKTTPSDRAQLASALKVAATQNPQEPATKE